ncbi:MAG: sigma-70 family RNA polymerase sigma factor [Eubacteriales bacterium]
MDETINIIIKEYMQQLFYFSLKKTSDSYEAEELTHDIILEVIKSFNSGSIPIDTKAWVWKIARNCYVRWAKKRAKTRANIDIDDISDTLADTETAEDNILDEEELNLLHRELSLLNYEYRHIVCEYYFQNRKLSEIAAQVGLPPGTVKRKLYECRNHLKEGIKMSRNYGKRSFAPENITFSQNWNPGTGPDGRRYVERLAPQNILLEAYDNPCTAEELSLALGLAMPYMEEEIRLLLEGGLLIKEGDRYKTNIVILSREAQDKLYDIGNEIADRLAPVVFAAVDEIGRKDNLPKNQSSEDMKPTLIEMLISHRNVKNASNAIHTIKHKDGSEWAIMGLEKTEKTAQWLEVWSNNVYHQITMLGNRTNGTALVINIADVPVFDGKTLNELLITSYETEIDKLLGEYHKKQQEILSAEIPQYLSGCAMFSGNTDFCRLVIDRAISCGYITLPDDMNKSAVGIWMYKK